LAVFLLVIFRPSFTFKVRDCNAEPAIPIRREIAVGSGGGTEADGCTTSLLVNVLNLLLPLRGPGSGSLRTCALGRLEDRSWRRSSTHGFSQT